MGRTPKKTASTSKSPLKTPTKKSPMKKAWASPIKSNLFANFSPLNESWAEITENDESLREMSPKSAPNSRRKHSQPRRAQTRPKFTKSLELTEALFSPNSSKRLQQKMEAMEQQNSRKRHISNASTINELEDLAGSPSKKANLDQNTPGKPAKKRGNNLLNAQNSQNSVPSSPKSPQIKVKDNWEEPKLGWCMDIKVQERRSREIERAKEKPVYQKFITEVAKASRQRGIHPRTPNKLLNYSRRSWDVQIRRWKRSLYEWAGEEPSESANTSFCCSDTDSVNGEGEGVENDGENRPILAHLTMEEIVIEGRPDTDVMASLLGKFDMDTRRGDESTLKPANCGAPVDGPTDFSTVHH